MARHRDELAEPKGHDGKVIAREAQRGDAENDAPQRAVADAHERGRPERQAVLLHQDAGGVGADKHEAAEAEV
jgi:hypothetical protein